jgi:AraC family transcriptional regulator
MVEHQNNLPLMLPQPPILVSANWKNIQFAQFRQPPCEIPEHISPFHVICMNAGKPVRLEQTIDGRKETVDSVLGDIAIYPAYATQAFRWNKAAEFFNLFLDPAFLAQTSYDVFGNDRVELIPHLATLSDPLVQQIGFALKTSLEIDGANSTLWLFICCLDIPVVLVKLKRS